MCAPSIEQERRGEKDFTRTARVLRCDTVVQRITPYIIGIRSTVGPKLLEVQYCTVNRKSKQESKTANDNNINELIKKRAKENEIGSLFDRRLNQNTRHCLSPSH